MEKQLSNHKLGTALAVILDENKTNQKEFLKEVKEIFRQGSQELSKQVNEVKTTKITVDTTAVDKSGEDLKKISHSLQQVGRDVIADIKRASKAFIIPRYLAVFFILLAVILAFSTWNSLAKVQELQTEKDKMQRYYNFTTEYFTAHPKEWERIKKWQPKPTKQP